MTRTSVLDSVQGKSPFTIHNLPYGVITTADNPERRCATAFRDDAIDLAIVHGDGLFQDIPGLEANVFASDTLNIFAALPHETRQKVRGRLIEAVETKSISAAAVFPLSDVQNHFPMATGNFSDFFCSWEHTVNSTEVMLGKPTFMPNWSVIPTVYNGRTSSLAISGTPITRPCGVFPQVSGEAQKGEVQFQPEGEFDFELEMGVFLSKPVPRGRRPDMASIKEHIFGFVLLNDWSARNIQQFESPFLGPFHAKGSGTSISPWIVALEALDRVVCPRASVQSPAPLRHLQCPEETEATFDIHVFAKVLRNGTQYLFTEANLNELHWTPFQQLVHLGSAGEGLSTGDIFGTGTISSSRTNSSGEKTGLGCILERKLRRNKLSSLPDDIAETFLLDGDEVVLEGWCIDRETSEVILGFGQCRGKVMPAYRSE
ncbi:hypothetical protein ASPZODRAFT_59507 [Penicilliopsis zonata CBS 506.65]|uniref:Fumarylacetoacetase n=1 Tax=Penicilliopsis zonata CBS 506.65 TaxID=1073090 RepID=A0A1L9STB2_9EURO|nr:hypothetical protein ASPZODRAFT_59507 [Penicilliopsis zonata CBS 506.65]OJJ50351.1 hypothetical protein ASPZODRAFT_59507 [Penicilliopsis zonata CBS 506.65]